MYADNIETIQDNGSATKGAKGDQGECLHNYVRTAIATEERKLLQTCISSFHPIAKPHSLNPQVHFSEVVLNPLIINKHHPEEKGLRTINVAIHTSIIICTSTFVIGTAGYTGPKGAPGQKGIKGDSGGGTVYVRWGHDQCPLTAELVYTGRMGGPAYNQGGSGSNPQCLPMDPSYLIAISGYQNLRATIYGAEYKTHTDSKSHIHGRQDFDIPCAVCYTSNHSAVYMVPAKYTCPSGWTRQYYGYLMAEESGGSRHRSQYSCMDTEFKPVNGTSANKNGLVLYFVEGRCGSLPCPPYDSTRELSCAVCTK